MGKSYQKSNQEISDRK